MDDLSELVRAWSVRVRLQWSLRWVFAGIAAGFALAIIPALIARISPIASQSTLLILGGVFAGIGLIAMLVWPWIRGRRDTEVNWARRFDTEFRLDERLSTAFELQKGAIDTSDENLRHRQQADAQNAAYGVNADTVLPWRFPLRQAMAALVALAALLLAIVLPNPQEEVLATREEVRRTLAEQSQALEAAKQAIQQSNLSEDQKQQALQALEDAQTKLNDPNTTPEQAMAALNEAQSKLESLRDQAWQQRQEDLQRAGQAMQPDEMTNSLADSLAKGNIDQAADQLSNLTETKDGQSLDETQQQRLANQLDQMAREIQNSDPSSAQRLRSAAQQLRENNAEAAREQLNQVAESLDDANQQAQASQSLDQSQAQVDAARQAVAQASQPEQQPQGNQAGQQQGQQGQQGQQQSEQQGQQQSQGSQSSPSQSDESGQPGNPADGEGQPSAGQTGQTGQEGQPSDSQATAGQSGNSSGGPPIPQVSPGHSEDSGTDNSVYAPGPRMGGDGSQVQLPEAQGENSPNPSGQSNPGIRTDPTVPYQNVYREYAEAADEAMQSGAVPPGLRDYVRDYFSSLDPNARR